MKLKGLLFVSLFLVSAFAVSFVVYPPPKSQACGNNVACTNLFVTGQVIRGAGVTTVTTANLVGLNEGDLLLVMATGATTSVNYNTPSDTKGSTFHILGNPAVSTSGRIVEYWWGVITAACASCSDAMTLTTTGTQTYLAAMVAYRTSWNVTSSTFNQFCSTGAVSDTALGSTDVWAAYSFSALTAHTFSALTGSTTNFAKDAAFFVFVPSGGASGCTGVCAIIDDPLPLKEALGQGVGGVVSIFVFAPLTEFIGPKFAGIVVKLIEVNPLTEFISKAGSGVLAFINNDIFALRESVCKHLPIWNCPGGITTPPGNNGGVFVLYDTPFDFLVTGLLFPVFVIVGFVMIARTRVKLTEEMILPIALFAVDLIAWAGSGTIFPDWMFLLTILISGGIISYMAVNWWTGRGGAW